MRARGLTIIAGLIALAGCGPAAGDEGTEAPPARVAAQFQHLAAGEAASGERLSRVLGCAGCHGPELRGQDWFEDPEFGVLHSANLTLAARDYSDAQLERAIRSGVRGDGTPLWDMPSHIFSRLSEADMAAIIAFLRTLEPGGEIPPPMRLGPEALRLQAAGQFRPEPDKVRATLAAGPPAIEGDHDWARYMIRATCAECHGLDLAGDPDMTGHSPPPPLSIVSAYSRPQFHHLLRTGEPVGGRTLGLMAMVARNRFSRLSDAEVDAIYDYLSALAERPQ